MFLLRNLVEVIIIEIYSTSELYPLSSQLKLSPLTRTPVLGSIPLLQGYRIGGSGLQAKGFGGGISGSGSAVCRILGSGFRV